jgi:hypothetical protein
MHELENRDQQRRQQLQEAVDQATSQVRTLNEQLEQARTQTRNMADIGVRLDDLETRIRTLTGTLDELRHSLDEATSARSQVANRVEAVERRLGIAPLVDANQIPADNGQLLALARTAFEARDYPRTRFLAQALVQRAAQDPNADDAMLLIARAQLAENRAATAVQELNRLLQTYPQGDAVPRPWASWPTPSSTSGCAPRPSAPCGSSSSATAVRPPPPPPARASRPCARCRGRPAGDERTRGRGAGPTLGHHPADGPRPRVGRQARRGHPRGGVPRHPERPRARRRGEAPQGLGGPGLGPGPALRARGAAPRGLRASKHPAGVWPERRRRRPPLPRARARRRLLPRRRTTERPRGGAAPRRGRPGGAAHRPGPGARPPARHRAPRREARQRAPVAPGRGQAGGLWPRPRPRRPHARHPGRGGLARVHEPRAGARRPPRLRERRLQLRHRAVRAAHGPSPLRGRPRAHGDAEDPARPVPPAAPRAPVGARDAGAHPRALPGEEPRAPLPQHGGSATTSRSFSPAPG